MDVSGTIEKILCQKPPEIWSVSPDATVYDAVALMAEKNVGALPVMEADRLVGMISERDYARKVILLGRGSRETVVSEIMTSTVTTVVAEDSVQACLQLMTENRIRHPGDRRHARGRARAWRSVTRSAAIARRAELAGVRHARGRARLVTGSVTIAGAAELAAMLRGRARARRLVTRSAAIAGAAEGYDLWTCIDPRASRWDAVANQTGASRVEGHEPLAHAGGSLRDMTRIAGANPRIWIDIFLDNADAVCEELADLRRRIEQVEAALAQRDAGFLARWIGEASDNRRRMLSDAYEQPGMLQRLRVHVPDRPGVLAGITQALGAERINIEDFELQHLSRERGGTLTLLVGGEDEAERAAKILEAQGYHVVVSPVLE
jgi:hypothetical protein